ncbi:MAG TPA: helix-turn-helix domain-containing protein [Usitatibacter sp.]|jgi:AcrR family transcriptional regulator|nr:helix-turn-helix domain-containing protein [Usitatibacter sp.]
MDAKPAAAPRSARERLLAAAAELFYAEGINTVGIDRIIERAGVAKASLYDTFGSKDELIRAYLADRAAARQARLEAWLARYKTPRDRILGIFDFLADSISQPTFNGCYFQRASAELKPASSARGACTDARGWTLALFTRLAKEAGLSNPKKAAQQLVILYDGAVVSASMDHDTHVAGTAKAMAAALLDAGSR